MCKGTYDIVQSIISPVNYSDDCDLETLHKLFTTLGCAKKLIYILHISLRLEKLNPANIEELVSDSDRHA